MGKKGKIFLTLTIILLGGASAFYWFYKDVYFPNVDLGNEKSVVVFILTGSTYDDVKKILADKQILKNEKSFDWVAEQKKYKNNIKPGRYRVTKNMSNNELINMLRSGNQEAVTLTFNNIRTKQQLSGRVARKLEVDSNELYKVLNDDELMMEKFGLKGQAVLSMFIPNSYQFYWNTSAEEFLKRMAAEYKKFWTEERKQKSKTINLSQTEVAVLASIVQEEQNRFDDEKKIIAGLYINRINKKMPLQSDPTVKFALGDFGRTRILNKDLEIDSPYNTYKNTGLPPGPICIPEISSLDAVLNYEKNNYLFMCAKEDFSGRHNFSKTLEQHNVYAAKYRKALDARNIKR
jgi:UPF0755 protein